MKYLPCSSVHTGQPYIHTGTTYPADMLERVEQPPGNQLEELYQQPAQQ